MSRKKKITRKPNPEPGKKYPGRYRDGRLLCDGWSVQKGEPCRALALKGRSQCRNHGGASLLGPDSPTYRTGRFSKIDSVLAGRLDSYLEDEDISDQRKSLAILDLFCDDLLLSGLSSHTIKALNKICDDIEKASLERDQAAVHNLVTNLMGVIRAARQDRQLREEVAQTLDVRNRIAKTQQKKEQDEKTTVPILVFQQMLKSFSDAIKTEIVDLDVRRRLIERVKLNGLATHTGRAGLLGTRGSA